MLSPRLVLTARQCVAYTDGEALCTEAGNAAEGGRVRQTHKPEAIYIFAGDTPPDFRGDVVAQGQGMAILDDGSNTICNNDIALIVLKEPIEGARIAPIRLDGDVAVGELITSIGWGLTEKSTQPHERQQRTNVAITNVGPTVVIGPHGGKPIGPNEFAVGESTCVGDTGGPAVSQDTKAVVGVVSRGGNGTAPPAGGNDTAVTCINGQNIYTKTAPFKDLILKGFAAVDAQPWLEGQPDPNKLTAKSACQSNDDCQSGLCLPDPDASNATTCAEDCSSTGTCSAASDVCTREGDSMVCRAKPVVKTSSCASTPASTSSSSGLGGASLAFGLFAVASQRRRRAGKPTVLGGEDRPSSR